MRSSRPLTALAVAVTVLAGGSTTLAAATTTHPEGGTVRFFSTDTTSTGGPATLTGVIGDWGTVFAADRDGTVDPRGVYEKLVLHHGTITIDTTRLSEVLARVEPQVNADNCSVVFQGTGPATIVSGTRAYQGISGTFSITLTAVAVGHVSFS